MSRLHVIVPRSFAEERRYIVGVLLGDFLGLDFTIESGPTDAYAIEHDQRRLVIRDAFFGRFEATYLAERNIPESASTFPHPFEAGERLTAIFGDSELVNDGAELRCGLDVFGSAFFMLTRWEETVSSKRDAHGRFLAQHALATRAGFLDRCVVNEWTELLWRLLERIGCTQRRKHRDFTVSVSHDVDYPRHWTLRTGVVTCAGDLLKRRSPVLALRTARDFIGTRTGLVRDPYDTFDWLMDCSEANGIKSTFNFMAGRWTKHDPPFDFEPLSLEKLVGRVARRGHVVGFHPSYNAYNDPALWKLEWDRLSQLSPQPIAVGREHYLRFAAPTTWQIWDDHGMAWDSTLGYADHEGFRCGTCYDYPVFNVQTRKQLKLREHPLVAMDATLVNYRKLSPDAARDALEQLRSECKKYGGELTLLWHNSNLAAEWTPYRDIYRAALRA